MLLVGMTPLPDGDSESWSKKSGDPPGLRRQRDEQHDGEHAEPSAAARRTAGAGGLRAQGAAVHDEQPERSASPSVPAIQARPG